MCNCVIEYVPRKEFRNGKHARWTKRKILRLIKAMEKQWKKFKNRPSHKNQMRYRKKRDEVSNEMAKVKLDFELKMAENII